MASSIYLESARTFSFMGTQFRSFTGTRAHFRSSFRYWSFLSSERSLFILLRTVLELIPSEAIQNSIDGRTLLTSKEVLTLHLASVPSQNGFSGDDVPPSSQIHRKRKTIERIPMSSNKLPLERPWSVFHQTIDRST